MLSNNGQRNNFGAACSGRLDIQVQNAAAVSSEHVGSVPLGGQDHHACLHACQTKSLFEAAAGIPLHPENC